MTYIEFTEVIDTGHNQRSNDGPWTRVPPLRRVILVNPDNVTMVTAKDDYGRREDGPLTIIESIDKTRVVAGTVTDVLTTLRAEKKREAGQ